ncbi:hypothetical protein D357_01272 [Enterococcus faecium SD3B-2]|nr:hypothetical protein D357_01272 [Enterococcus faecium SD3B-2]MBL4989475.1 hypothetical protein [Enterococcus lactis]MBL4993008.1 hypothetical protein [Enterococcus lactis]
MTKKHLFTLTDSAGYSSIKSTRDLRTEQFYLQVYVQTKKVLNTNVQYLLLSK